MSRPRGKAAAAAAALFALGAVALSPELLARLFSDDGVLGAYIVARLRFLRAASAAGCALSTAWLFLPAAARERVRGTLAAAAGSRAAAGAVFLFCAYLFSTEMNSYEFDPTSYGICLYGAGVTAAGGVPCRDFWSYLPPGFFYWTAASFKLFGPSIESARLFTSIVPKFLILLFLFGLARRLVPRGPALGAVLFAAVFLSQNPEMARLETQYMALMLSIASLSALLRFSGGREAQWAAASGAAAAAAGLFRQDFALYTLLTDLCGLGLFFFAVEPRNRGSLRPLAAFGAAWAAVIASAGLWMVSQVPLDLLLECYLSSLFAYMEVYSSYTSGMAAYPLQGLFEWARGETSLARAIFYLATRDMGPFLSVAAVLGGCGWAASRLKNIKTMSDWEKTAAVLSIFCLFYMGYPIKGGGFPYIGVGSMAGVLVVAFLHSLRTPGPPRGRRNIAFSVVLAVFSYYTGVLYLFRPLGTPEGMVWAKTPAGKILSKNEKSKVELEKTLYAIESVTRPDDPIFVYDDPLHNAYTILYFLAGRRPGTRYGELMGSVSATPRAQKKIVSELEKNRVNLVVDATLPHQKGVYPPDRTVKDYLEARFAESARFGDFRILRRRRP